MAETLVLKAQQRHSSGTRSSRKLRTQGLIPAIIYGHKQDPVSVQLNAHDLILELQHHHRVLDVDLEGQHEKCFVKDVQYDYLGEKILHVDLARVSMDETIQVSVALELRGTPVGTAENGVLEQLLAELEIQCRVTDIPENIRVRVNDLKIDDTVTAGEIELPEGAILVTAPDTPVAIVRLRAEIAEEAEVVIAPAEETGEPKVIQREKTLEEESD